MYFTLSRSEQERNGDNDEKIDEAISDSQLSSLMRSIEATSTTYKTRDQYLRLVLRALVLNQVQVMRLLDFVYPKDMWEGRKERAALRCDLLKQIAVVVPEEVV